MKIAMVGSRGIPARYGGSETAIESLLSSEERRCEMGAAGAARVREEFTIEKHVARLMSLYQELTEESAR